jgi:hypothetical protein
MLIPSTLRKLSFFIIFMLGLLGAVQSAQAVGIVSRSCLGAGAQESITVDWTLANNWYWTASEHYRNGALLHTPNSGWSNTWRSYAGHLGSEFWYGFVAGHHWRWTASTGTALMGISTATDCNLSQWGF